MSDLSCAAAAVLAFSLVYLGLASQRRWPIYCAAVVLGVSLSIRPQLLFFAPLLISMALFPGVPISREVAIALRPGSPYLRTRCQPIFYSKHCRIWSSA
jgi:hypothetical protein